MDDQSVTGSWRHLLGRDHRGPITVLAGGVALYATNVYVSTSLLPTAVAEIGGERLYAWNTTVFLLTSVIASVLVSRLLAATTPARAYLLALAVFVVGTLACAAAPTMEVLLAGRAVQGAGGGLLAGLGYALIRSTLPPTLWTRGSALVSAMWGVGIFAGPVLGGAFSELGSWRGAFLALAVASAAMALLVPRALAGSRTDGRPEALPLISVLLLATAALVVSVASLAARPLVALGGVAVALVLLVGFVARERGSAVGVLPAATFRAGSPLRWIYLTIALLAIGSTTETFVPLFGQRLAGLAPLAAGFLGAALAAGWTLGELPSAGVRRPVAMRTIVTAGPLVLAAGLALTALTQGADAGGVQIGAWILGLLIAGAGIGMAWPHLATAAMGSASDAAEGDKASAAINTVQLVANALGTSLTGVAVNLGAPDDVRSAQLLFGGFAVLAVLGVLTAARTRAGSSVVAAPSDPGGRRTARCPQGAVDVELDLSSPRSEGY